jgi:hypothetical protein
MNKLLFIVAALAVSCGSGNSDTKKTVEQPLVKEAPTLPAHPDFPPKLSMNTTPPPVIQNDPVQIAATESFCTKSHCFVRVEPQIQITRRVGFGAQPHAVWTEPGIIRIVGPILPKSLSFHVASPFAGYDQVWTATDYTDATISIAAKLPKNPKLESEFWTHVGPGFLEYGARDEFVNFAQLQLAQRAPATAVPTRNTNRSELYDLMSIYTGMTSINEALQADRILNPAAAAEKADIPLEGLSGVPLPAHPWPEMIKELGVKPVVEPMASYIPADMAYVHFSDLRDFVKLARDFDDWITPATQMLETRPGTSHFIERYEKMLVIERTGLAEALGHVVADGVALTTSDPYLREGSDLSLVFKVKSRPALIAALNQFEANARKVHPDLEEAFWKDGTTIVRRLFTPDGEIEQNRVEFGDVLIISNSRGAIRAFLDAQKPGGRKLADEGDFQYLRAKYPFDSKESGFVFLSDVFVARAVSPEIKILESRRVVAKAELAMPQYATLLYGYMEGKRATAIKDVVAAGYLQQANLKHSDGQSIQFSADEGALSAWGRTTFLTPIRDLSLKTVTATEKTSYERFSATYQSYWKAFIDPIGIRINKDEDGKGWNFDGRILPLIDNSDYDEFIEMVGKATVRPATVNTGVQYVFAVGKDARLRKELDGASRNMIPGVNLSVGWLGDWVTVGAEDRSGLWDLAMLGLSASQGRADMNQTQTMEALSRAPLYVGAHVANSIALGAFLTGIKGLASSAAPGMIRWEESAHYRDVPIVRVGTNPGAPEGDMAVHYAIYQDKFVLAVERATLEIQIDRILDGAWPSPAEGTDADTQTAIAARLGDAWLTKSLLAMAELGIHQGHYVSERSYEELVFGLPGAIKTAADARRLGVVYLGYEPRSAHGGDFSMVDGYVSHPLYGTLIEPKLPAVPVENSDLTKAVQTIQKIGGSLDFEGEGNHRGLRFRFALSRY